MRPSDAFFLFIILTLVVAWIIGYLWDMHKRNKRRKERDQWKG